MELEGVIWFVDLMENPLGLFQDCLQIPDGPTIVSSDGLVATLKREKTKRTPVFKIPTLREILNLFETPKHAGFGNRDTDTETYNSVGIPMERIFIVVKKDEDTSYLKILQNIDTHFPILKKEMWTEENPESS